MSEEQENSENNPISDTVTEKAKRRGRPPSSATKAKSPTAIVSQAEASLKLYHVFKFLARITKSDVTFTKEEFREMGAQYADLSVYSLVFSKILRYLAPIGLVGEIFDKFNKVREAMPKRVEKGEKENIPVSLLARLRAGRDGNNAQPDNADVPGTGHLPGE